MMKMTGVIPFTFNERSDKCNWYVTHGMADNGELREV